MTRLYRPPQQPNLAFVAWLGIQCRWYHMASAMCAATARPFQPSSIYDYFRRHRRGAGWTTPYNTVRPVEVQRWRHREMLRLAPSNGTANSSRV